MSKRGKVLSSGIVEIQYDEQGRPYVTMPLPPGYRAVSKEGIPLLMGGHARRVFVEFPDEITIIKDVN